MEKQLQLVTFEQAKKLKELGFDWGVYHCYNNIGQLQRCGFTEGTHLNNPAPFVALALKWFRETKKYFGYSNMNSPTMCWGVWSLGNSQWKTTDYFRSYEAAEIVLLDELLKIIEIDSSGNNTPIFTDKGEVPGK